MRPTNKTTYVCVTCGSEKGIHSGDGYWTCSKCGDEWPEDAVATKSNELVLDALDMAVYWANEARKATLERNEAIVAAIDAGASMREVARATLLSHVAVGNIYKRTAAHG